MELTHNNIMSWVDGAKPSNANITTLIERIVNGKTANPKLSESEVNDILFTLHFIRDLQEVFLPTDDNEIVDVENSQLVRS